MDKIALKKKVFEKAEETLEQLVIGLKNREKASLDAAIEEFQEELGVSSFGKGDEELDEARLIHAKVLEAEGDLNRLRRFVIDDEVHQEIEPPCIVRTNQGNYFIGVAVRHFDVEGVTYTGISTEAPIFRELEGHKEGDSIDFRGKTFDIQEVF